MVTNETKIPPAIRGLLQTVAFGAFIFGTISCHSGLKMMVGNTLAWVAAVFFLVIYICAFELAIKNIGRNIALIGCFVCASFFFISNLNSFYPNDLKEKMVKEEAIMLNDSLQSFANKVPSPDAPTLQKYIKLDNIKSNLLVEVRKNKGYGENAKKILKEFNDNLGDEFNVDFHRIENKDWDDIAADLDTLCTKAMNSFVNKTNREDVRNILLFNEGKKELDSVQRAYTPIFVQIINDTAQIDLNNVKGNKNIRHLGDFITKLDNATDKINKSTEKEIYTKFGKPKSEEIGIIWHTLNMAFNERFGKGDSYPPIAFALSLDFLIPLLVFSILRKPKEKPKKEEKEEKKILDLIRKNQKKGYRQTDIEQIYENSKIVDNFNNKNNGKR
jgi:hypothetical protein